MNLRWLRISYKKNKEIIRNPRMGGGMGERAINNNLWSKCEQSKKWYDFEHFVIVSQSYLTLQPYGLGEVL